MNRNNLDEKYFQEWKKNSEVFHRFFGGCSYGRDQRLGIRD